MQAAVVYKPNGPMEIVEVEQRGPQAGEARVRVKATGRRGRRRGGPRRGGPRSR
jgi:Zn-dependent alcohol dehydrogenase